MAVFNYFNYFTEIEEYFWRKRGAHLLISPLDWAILETWQKAGIPLEAVLKGIDRAFDSWARSRRAAAGRHLKSLAYCVDAVLDAATQAREAAAGKGPQATSGRAAKEAFSRLELRGYFAENTRRLLASAARHRAAHASLGHVIEETARRLEELGQLFDSPAALDLEDLERRLTVLEEKLSNALFTVAGEEDLVAIRREMDRALAPHRRKMTAGQLQSLERQYTQKRLYETFAVPRLSLFYLT